MQEFIQADSNLEMIDYSETHRGSYNYFKPQPWPLIDEKKIFFGINVDIISAQSINAIDFSCSHLSADNQLTAILLSQDLRLKKSLQNNKAGF
ncbi:MAG: hypothetical protein ABIK73_00790 [candidate division WOR-3 bacterium]